jgi:hypothetical protein
MEIQDWINLAFMAWAIICQIQMVKIRKRLKTLGITLEVTTDKVFDGDTERYVKYTNDMLMKRMEKAGVK